MRTMLFEVRNIYVQAGPVAQETGFPDCFISDRLALLSVFADSLSRSSSLHWRRVWQTSLSSWRSDSFRGCAAPGWTRPRLPAGILFYRRLAQLLATYELARNPAETQSEFAGRAHKFLTGKGSPTQPVADVPREVVDAFYRVRFGHLELEPDSLHELNARLDALESSLKSP